MTVKAKATIEDLYSVPENGKAEIVNGELVIMGATGGIPGRAAAHILASLISYEDQSIGGFAFGDNVGFVVNLPNRISFSPDVAWYTGSNVSMKFLQGAPAFAVEVRSENDYGSRQDDNIRAKIADYFAAGTQVVWDVDMLGSEVVRKYTVASPNIPVIFRRGETADAEPAVPGWTLPVDRLFR